MGRASGTVVVALFSELLVLVVPSYCLCPVAVAKVIDKTHNPVCEEAGAGGVANLVHCCNPECWHNNSAVLDGDIG